MITYIRSILYIKSAIAVWRTKFRAAKAAKKKENRIEIQCANQTGSVLRQAINSGAKKRLSAELPFEIAESWPQYVSRTRCYAVKIRLARIYEAYYHAAESYHTGQRRGRYGGWASGFEKVEEAVAGSRGKYNTIFARAKSL